MKSVSLFALLALSSVGALAGDRLPADLVSVTPIREVLSADVVVPPPPPSRPGGPIFEVVSRLRIVFPLVGCADQLGPVTHHKEYLPSGKYVVYVSAMNYGRAMSESVRCLVAPTATREIFLGMGFFSQDMIEKVVVLQ